MNHNSYASRLKFGNDAEQEFKRLFKCTCGGEWNFTGYIRAGEPDFKCSSCGARVDVKTSGYNVTISEIPYNHYPPQLLIAVKSGATWRGVRKCNAKIKNGPHPPAHAENGTNYYIIDGKCFSKIEDTGAVKRK